MSGITLRVLRNTKISSIYKKLLLRKRMNDREKQALLSIAVILINAGNDDTKELGYRIIVLYSNSFSDYKPLYDVSLGKGYTPIVKSIEERARVGESFGGGFFDEWYSSFGETFKKDGIYLTSQQKDLSLFFRDHIDNGVAVVAPTSYGKSELFVDFCNAHDSDTIVILVPTKALLAQVKRRVIQGSTWEGDERKIITHPEMYNPGDKGFIGILTQERLLRMMQGDRDLSLDYVFIDEAHNLLSGDQRSLLLAKVIALASVRNAKTSFSYLTPFVVSAENLRTKYTSSKFTSYKISEHLKTERYYAIDYREGGGACS